MAYSAKDFFRNPLSIKASVIWSGLGSLLVLAIIVASLIAWAVTPANAQEREFNGPVAEGSWVVPDFGVMICPAWVEPGNVDPEQCLAIKDHWGPYPDEAMCNRRMAQMGQEFPVIQFQMTGVPWWGMTTSCEQAGTDA